MKALKTTLSGFTVLILIAAVFSLSSCKKDKENTTSDSHWSVDNRSFEANKLGAAVVANDTAAVFGAATKANEAILILFKSLPSAGTYKIVGALEKSIEDYNADECSILITAKNPTASYLSAPATNNTLQITSRGGKLTATFSNIDMYYLSGGETLYTTAIGTLVEK